MLPESKGYFDHNAIVVVTKLVDAVASTAAADKDWYLHSLMREFLKDLDAAIEYLDQKD